MQKDGEKAKVKERSLPTKTLIWTSIIQTMHTLKLRIDMIR
jgi:hypothetical protein